MRPTVWRATLLVAIVAGTSGLIASARQPRALYAIRTDRILDPRTGQYSSPSIILVAGGRISDVVPAASYRSDMADSTIDLPGLTVLPGRIAGHVHRAIGGPPAQNALADLRAGFTTVVDLGARTHRLLRIREMQAHGTTIMFVSHEMGMIKAVCSRVVLLDAGQILEEGGPAEITSLYFARASAQIAQAQAPHDPVTITTSPAEPRFAADPDFDAQARVFRHGTGAAKIRRIELLDSCGRPVTAVAFNDEAILRVHAEFLADVPSSIIGFGFRDRAGIELIGTNTF